MKKRKICVVTNTRADYSRLKTLLRALQKDIGADLPLCVAGSHMLSNYGRTIQEIEKDGFEIAYRLYTEVDGHVPTTMTKSTGLAIIEFSSFFENSKPDIVVVHGDRFEAFAAAAAASMMNIHVAHVQGGEVTGTIDEHLRHAITKLSHFHFASDALSAERIIKLGEKKEHVFNVGCPSVDVLLSAPEMSFEELKKAMEPYIKKKKWLENLKEDFILFAQHPVTTDFDRASEEVEAALAALTDVPNNILALWPNIDAGAESIAQSLKTFEREHDDRVAIVNNFTFDIFINLMRHAKVMVGNSSAGVREACYFGTPVVNIGSRQEGRLRTKNVIDATGDKVKDALATQLSKEEKYDVEYPYGKGGSGEKIAEILTTIELGSSQKRLTL